MLEAGDLDGYAVWRRILRAVEELLSKHALAMARDGAMLQISGHPSLMVPRLEREPERFRIGIEDHRNPCLVPRRIFLKGSYCP